MRRSFYSLLTKSVALAALASSAPLAAQQSTNAPLPDLAALTVEQLIDLVRNAGDRWIDEPCTFSVPVSQALADKSGDVPRFRRASLIAQTICADREQRYADGARLTQQLNTVYADEPLIGYALYFADRMEDSSGALDILRTLDNRSLGHLSRENFWRAYRLIRRDGRAADLEALALGWAESGHLAHVDESLRPFVAHAALRSAAAAQKSDMADPLLQQISNPSTYIGLLTEREFEPFWPRIEARAGANLAWVGAEHVRIAQERLAAAPDDRDRFSDAAHALHYNGEFARAIEMARRWRVRAERGAAIEEGDAWALNIQAYAHDSLGQRASADAIFDELAAIDADEHGWVVNFVINRASRLVSQGRWSEGLVAASLARTVAETHGSTFAKLLIARDHACALQRLGRGGEATGELGYLRENWREGVEMSAEGLMCHGLHNEAAGLLLQALRDDRLRLSALSALQPPQLELFYTASILPNAPDLLADFPELAAELARHVRPMPERFVPQAALRRIRVPLPAS